MGPVERMVRRQCLHLESRPDPLKLFLERALPCQPKVAYLLTSCFPRGRVVELVLRNFLCLQGEEQGCAIVLRDTHSKKSPLFLRHPMDTLQISRRFSCPFGLTIFRKTVQRQSDVLLHGFVPHHLVEHTFLRCNAADIDRWHRVRTLVF